MEARRWDATELVAVLLSEAQSYRLPVCACLLAAAAALIRWSQWQLLLLRLLLTALFATLLAQWSSVARVLRALYVYRFRKHVGLGQLQGVLLEQPLVHRTETRHLTPHGAAKVSGAVGSESKPTKPLLHNLEEKSWREPMWCKHCGGFLWGAWKLHGCNLRVFSLLFRPFWMSSARNLRVLSLLSLCLETEAGLAVPTVPRDPMPRLCGGVGSRFLPQR